MEWIHLALDEDQWIAFRFHKTLGISSVAQRLVASPEGQGPMELVSFYDYQLLKINVYIF
jgi:hypothetical protein